MSKDTDDVLRRLRDSAEEAGKALQEFADLLQEMEDEIATAEQNSYDDGYSENEGSGYEAGYEDGEHTGYERGYEAAEDR